MIGTVTPSQAPSHSAAARATEPKQVTVRRDADGHLVSRSGR
jgi:hypothetical protein